MTDPERIQAIQDLWNLLKYTNLPMENLLTEWYDWTPEELPLVICDRFLIDVLSHTTLGSPHNLVDEMGLEWLDGYDLKDFDNIIKKFFM